MRKRLLALAIIPLFSIGLVGCDIEEERPGRAPDIDVRTDPGKLPEYEKVEEGRAPDVDVDVDLGKLPRYDVDVQKTEEGRAPSIDVDVTTPEEQRPRIETDAD